MYFKPQFSSKSSQAPFYGTTMCVQCIIVFRLANLQTKLKRTIKMRFLATIFILVNIFSSQKPVPVDDQLFAKRFSTNMESSEMYICTIWSDVQFPVDPLTAEGRLGITTWKYASLSEGARSDELIQCLVMHMCGIPWAPWPSNGLRLIIIGVALIQTCVNVFGN